MDRKQKRMKFRNSMSKDSSLTQRQAFELFEWLKKHFVIVLKQIGELKLPKEVTFEEAARYLVVETIKSTSKHLSQVVSMIGVENGIIEYKKLIEEGTAKFFLARMKKEAEKN